MIVEHLKCIFRWSAVAGRWNAGNWSTVERNAFCCTQQGTSKAVEAADKEAESQ